MEVKKYKNLLSQTFTQKGKLNFYVVDDYDDLAKIPQDEIEIIGCRAYVINNGKFYIMDSNNSWHEQDFIYDISFDETITRRGVYTFTIDPQIHDGMQKVKITVEPTLQPFEEIFTRAGEYERKYNRANYDGFDDLKISFQPTLQSVEETVTRSGEREFNYDSENYDGLSNVKANFQPTLQSIEEEITENGEYEFNYDSENYDGLSSVKINVETVGGVGDGTVLVDSLDTKPDYLENKLITKEGSGIIINVNHDTNQMEISYSPSTFEADFLETLPFASLQAEDVPSYSNSNITMIASTLMPDYNFSFEPGVSKISFYSSVGNMTNCRLLVLRVNDDNSATVIAYSELFNTQNKRSRNKISALCEYASEKIKSGRRYYIGLAGTPVSTSWLRMFGYSHWAAQDLNFSPPFNVYSDSTIDINNPVTTIQESHLLDNNAFYVYFSLERS